jgi:hypothetical protein
MGFILTLEDLGLLLLFLGLTSLITSELLSARYGPVDLVLNAKRLRRAALLFCGVAILLLGAKYYDILIALFR